jgi:hypothetical protein
MADHTAGPWEWWTSNGLHRLSAGGKDGNVLCAVRLHDGFADIQVSEEDARLIAASPDLLAALRATRRELQACQAVIHLAGGFDPAYVSGAQEAIRAADAALSKATAKAPGV